MNCDEKFSISARLAPSDLKQFNQDINNLDILIREKILNTNNNNQYRARARAKKLMEEIKLHCSQACYQVNVIEFLHVYYMYLEETSEIRA